MNGLKINMAAYLTTASFKMDMELNLEFISGEQEAHYEATSVEYAMRIAKKPQQDAVISGGSGSVQMVGVDTFISCDAPLAMGASIIRDSEDRAEGVAKWAIHVEDALRDRSLQEYLSERVKEEKQAP